SPLLESKSYLDEGITQKTVDNPLLSPSPRPLPEGERVYGETVLGLAVPVLAGFAPVKHPRISTFVAHFEHHRALVSRHPYPGIVLLVTGHHIRLRKTITIQVTGGNDGVSRPQGVDERPR